MATEDSGCTATINWLREMDLWLILEAEDLRVLEVLDMAIMLASAQPVMVIMLAMVGLSMGTLAMLEVELALEVEAV